MTPRCLNTWLQGNAIAPTDSGDMKAAQQYLKDGEMSDIAMKENEADQAFRYSASSHQADRSFMNTLPSIHFCILPSIA